MYRIALVFCGSKFSLIGVLHLGLLILFLSPFVVDFESLEGINRIVVPFMACGDLSGYDADKTYPVQVW